MKSLIQQFSKFVVIGGLTTALDFIILYLLCDGWSLHYLISTAVAFTLSTVFNYLASMRYVFVSRYAVHERHREALTFLFLSVLGLALTQGLMYTCVDLLQLNVFLGKVLVTGIVMFFNFFTRKIFIEAK